MASKPWVGAQREITGEAASRMLLRCTLKSAPKKNRLTQQDAAHTAVDEQEDIVGRRAIDVAGLGAILVADGLEHEAKQDENPEPVGAPEAGGVVEGEGGEEGAAEHHQGGEREFPLAAHGVGYESTLQAVAGPKQHGLPSLHEQEEHEQGSQYGDEQPPVVLQMI